MGVPEAAGAIQGVGAGDAPPPPCDELRLSNTTGILQKRKPHLRHSLVVRPTFFCSFAAGLEVSNDSKGAVSIVRDFLGIATPAAIMRIAGAQIAMSLDRK